MELVKFVLSYKVIISWVFSHVCESKEDGCYQETESEDVEWAFENVKSVPDEELPVDLVVVVQFVIFDDWVIGIYLVSLLEVLLTYFEKAHLVWGVKQLEAPYDSGAPDKKQDPTVLGLVKSVKRKPTYKVT